MKFIGILKIKVESNASFHREFSKLISTYLEWKKIKHNAPQTLLQRKQIFWLASNLSFLTKSKLLIPNLMT